MSKNMIRSIELTSIDSATFTGNYQAINTDGLEEACTLIRFVNDSNRDVIISYDGLTPHDYLRATDSLTLNFQANNQPSGLVSMLKQGTIVYVSGTAGGTGSVYLAGYYNPRN